MTDKDEQQEHRQPGCAREVIALELASSWKLTVLFLRLYLSLDAVVGGDAALARVWLHAENVRLCGVPAERIRCVEGLVDVIQHLDGMRGRL